MATVLCISSQVVRGYVGGSAARAALERRGHEAWLLPTVVLSNHPGHPRCGGEQAPTGRLAAMLDALDANGWLDDVDAVMTGYMPAAEHVAFAASAIRRVRERHAQAMLLCDPIMGDVPGGLYLDESVAHGIRDVLLGGASIATPNAFELGWLTGRNVVDARSARDAAEQLGVNTVLVTSVPGAANRIVNLLLSGGRCWLAQVERRSSAPHGTGDLMAALLLAALLEGVDPPSALAGATSGVEAALDASEDRDELRLFGRDAKWASGGEWPVEEMK